MLTIVLIIHDGTGITVYDIGKLLLRHPFLLPSPLDGESYIVEVKFALISLKIHNITQYHFTFRVIVFERDVFSYF